MKLNIILLNLIALISGEQLFLDPIPYHSIPVNGTKGGVSADSAECSKLGLEILKVGGNAIDSSITTTLCQGLIYPFASGIGGGGFMLVKLANDSSYFINFREMAPKLSNSTMFKKANDSLLGGLAVGIPGEIKGLEVAHQLFGKLSWKRVLEPVINLARYGYKVTKQLELRLKRNEGYIRTMAGLNSTYVNKDNSLAAEGQVLKRKSLANTLEQISIHGSKAFYQGPIAEAMVKSVQSNGGILQLEDLDKYKVEVVPALKAKFLNHDIHFLPPPASGIVAYHALKILENLNKPELDIDVVLKMVEAFKFAYVGRLNLGDPNFNNLGEAIKNILNENGIKREYERIEKLDITQEPKFYVDFKEQGFKEDHGTSHVSIIDKDRMSVSVTSTINTDFGSKLLDLETGILFNNEMDDFSNPSFSNFFGFPPSKENFVEPYKRPQSSMTPIILSNSDKLLSIGASGGSRIITSVVQSVFFHTALKLKLNAAIDTPRFHHQLLPNSLRVENNSLSDAAFAKLKVFNHTVIITERSESVVNAVEVSFKKEKCKGTLVTAVTDKRKDGIAAAY
ncbi:gamma-glutamyltranspeptidase [Neoconidiobolus thromboides FSU 785]|nr:gamma-glutamyltranspeptidase [Neoconidiobolus thromboides FSU 785]